MKSDDWMVLRQTVVGFLATRRRLAFSADTIRKSVLGRGIIEKGVTESDYTEALLFGESKGFVTREYPTMGAVTYWKATAKGISEAERNGWLL
jgi:hypothetical protein